MHKLDRSPHTISRCPSKFMSSPIGDEIRLLADSCSYVIIKFMIVFFLPVHDLFSFTIECLYIFASIVNAS